jgi:nitroreductase
MAGSVWRGAKRAVKRLVIGLCRCLCGLAEVLQRRVLHATLEQLRAADSARTPFAEMDADLLGQFIRFYGHSLEKAVRNEFAEGRGIEKYRQVSEAIAEWRRRGLPRRAFIDWAERNLAAFDRWQETRQPQLDPAPPARPAGADASVFDVMRSRVSVRFWQRREVEAEKINAVLEAATWAPSSCNRQPWKFYVTRNEAPKDGTCSIGVSNVSLRQKAPVVIYISVDERLFPERYAPAVDAGIVGQQMCLAATALGLGGCMMYGGENFAQDELRARFGMPPHEYVYLVVLLGYASEGTDRDKRVSTEDVCRFA